jgi:hypothetical protein
MKNEKMFEMATRTKMRFAFKGLISVEDLWDLSVENLDSIFKNLNSRLKNVNEDSLLAEYYKVKSKQDTEVETKIGIVKYIVDTKLDEEKARVESKERKEKKQKILEILSSKQNEDLQSKSVDELRSMLDEIDG